MHLTEYEKTEYSKPKLTESIYYIKLISIRVIF